MRRAPGIDKRIYSKRIIPESSDFDSSVNERQAAQILRQNSRRRVLESECSQTPPARKRYLKDENNSHLSDIDMFDDGCVDQLITSTSFLPIETSVLFNEPRLPTSREQIEVVPSSGRSKIFIFR